MAFNRITDDEVNAVGVENLEDRPALSASQLKAKFEETAKRLLVPKFNALVDWLNALNIENRTENRGGIRFARIRAEDDVLEVSEDGATWKGTVSAKLVDPSGLVPEQIGAVPDTRTVNGKSLAANIVLEKEDIGLGNVDNTADADKSVNYAASAGTAGSAEYATRSGTADTSGNSLQLAGRNAGVYIRVVSFSDGVLTLESGE